MSVKDIKASIIILTHNYLKETTLPCLESLFINSSNINFEVIVVDNGSSDDTVSYLQNLRKEHDNLQCLFNKKNSGFATGNNMGIKAAEGNYLILLNNDTVTTKGWLEKLLDPLELDQNIGLVGPVTNSVGNEQMIYTSGDTVREIVDQGELWCERSKGRYFETDLLGFFCVTMRKDLPEKIGILDETFGLGFYEDDDFCYRVKKAGLKLLCREDVFVYHKGSATFQYTNKNSVKRLIKSNKKKFERKIGTKYDPAHPRDKIFDLVNRDLDSATEKKISNNLLYRVNNRMKLLTSLRPKGFFKKIMFDKKMTAIKNSLNDKKIVSKREKRKCVIIVGMHRSGTSAMSAILKSLGLFNNGIICESPDNPKGFYEWEKGVRINEQIFKALRTSWDDETPFRPEAFKKKKIKKYKKKIMDAIEEDFMGQDHFVIKDPRISLLIPLYTESFMELDIEPLFVIMERDDEEIYLSLKKRNGFSRGKSLSLCKKYKDSVRQNIPSYKHTVIQFNDLVKRPVETVQEVIESLDLPFVIDEETKSAILDLVDPKLKHHNV